MKLNTRNPEGFTLIELLVSISIIGILAALAIFGLQGSFEKSRDTKRKSDLTQYQAALNKLSVNNKGLFPNYPIGSEGGTRLSTTICSLLNLTNCPEDHNYDPASAGPVYQYGTQSGIGGVSGEITAPDYVVWAKLEDVPSGVNAQYWVICGNGASGTTTTEPVSSPTDVCPF